MLNIQVLGTGLIPRGKGIAPRKEPFAANKDTIKTILAQGRLTVNMIHPKTGAKIPITNANLDKMWAAYANMEPEYKKNKVTTATKPVVPQTAVNRASTPATPTAPQAREVTSADIKNAVNNVMNATAPATAPVKEEPAPVVEKVEETSKVTETPKSESPTKTETKTEDKSAKNDNNSGNKTPQTSFKPVNAPEKK